MYTNTSRDIYNDGSDITGTATTDVAGKTFAAIAGPMDSNQIQVTTAAAGKRAAGVLKYDAATGELVGLARGNARVLTVTAAATLTAGQDVQVGEAGKAAPAADGVVVGYAVDAAEAGTDAKISLI